jgi:hypothetical protein
MSGKTMYTDAKGASSEHAIVGRKLHHAGMIRDLKIESARTKIPKGTEKRQKSGIVNRITGNRFTGWRNRMSFKTMPNVRILSPGKTGKRPNA